MSLICSAGRDGTADAGEQLPHSYLKTMDVVSTSPPASPMAPPTSASSHSSPPSPQLTTVKSEPASSCTPPLDSPPSLPPPPPPPLPPPPPPTSDLVARRCAWCSQLHTEHTAAIVAGEQCFCNELCFAHSRRARFKRSKGGAVENFPSAVTVGQAPPLTPTGPRSRPPTSETSAAPTNRHSTSPRGALYRSGPPCCPNDVAAAAAAAAAAGMYAGPMYQTVLVPVPLPVPIPIFKNAPELLDILRRHNFKPGTPPPPPPPPPPPLMVQAALGAKNSTPVARATSADEPHLNSEEENVLEVDQALDLSMPKGLGPDLRHLMEASYYKARRQLILDKPYAKGGSSMHFHRRSFKSMRRK